MNRTELAGVLGIAPQTVGRYVEKGIIEKATMYKNRYVWTQEQVDKAVISVSEHRKKEKRLNIEYEPPNDNLSLIDSVFR